MPPMLSIDFGNTYTKVALRVDADTRTQFLKDPALVYDEANLCVPTVAACYEARGKLHWCYGVDLLTHQYEPGLKVYRNWKPRFFEGVPEARLAAPALAGAVRAGAPPTPPGMTDAAWEATAVSGLSEAQLWD